jgi:lactoylglutathione lyase
MNRSLLVLFLVASILPAGAQKPEMETKIRLNHIAVYVHDLKTSTAFYDSVLVLKKIAEPFKDGLHTWYSLGNAGQLHLIQGAEKNIPRNKNDHLCFSVPAIEDFIIRLRKHDVKFSNWPGDENQITTRVDGVKQIHFQDPDGHWIEINNDFGKTAN